MPGTKPASAAPNKKRRIYKCVGVWTKPHKITIIPQVNMMRKIHNRAPTFCKIRLLGTSKKKKLRKYKPDNNPNASAVNPKSAFILKAAYPIFTRSKNECRFGING